MKHLKMFLIVVFAMATSLVFASTAFATYATSPAGTIYTGTLAGTSEGHVIWDTPIMQFECNFSMEGKIEVHGAGVTGQGKATNYTYKECNSNIVIHTVKTGTLEIHSAGKGVGTITSSGTEGRATLLSFGIECVYSTNNTDLGVVTDSSITGGPATLDLSATVPRTGGSAFCGTSATLTAAAVVNTPEEVFID
ncbi:MAG TPA: hypothetical protein VFY75_10995 [Solirubrobacterales bacterium]|nr:hypothetical protein [Solirubrobacterales bacterium]